MGRCIELGAEDYLFKPVNPVLLRARVATGTEQRATYTCVGETVNLAAHLEAHTKDLGRPILIDENTRSGLGEKLRVEPHGPAQFKRSRNAVQIYSVPPGQGS